MVLQNFFKFTKVKMYADDLTIYAAINNNEDNKIFLNELNELLSWANKLLLLLLILIRTQSTNKKKSSSIY